MNHFSRYLKAFTATLLSVLMLTSNAYASVTHSPQGLQPNDLSTLSAQLSATATTTTINAVTKWVNGIKTRGCFNTTYGFVQIQDSLGRTENASFDGNSCDGSNITTLSNMVRGLSQTAAGYTGGTGLQFDAGSQIKVVDYPTIYNKSMYVDAANTCTSTGCIQFSGSGAFRVPVFASSTIRDHQIPSPSNGMLAYVTADTFLYQYTGGAWITIGTSTFVNASETSAGKVQLGTIKDQTGSTVTGSSGAPTVVQTRYLTGSGGTAAFRGKIPYLGTGGLLSPTVIPTALSFLTLAGDSASGSITLHSNMTLTKDENFTSLTLNGFTVFENGYKIFVKGTLSGSGTINAGTGGNAGNAATSTAGTAGMQTSTGSIAGGVPGRAGSAGQAQGTPGVAGLSGISTRNAITTVGCVGGGFSGNGGIYGGGSGTAGAAGGSTGSTVKGNNNILNLFMWGDNFGSVWLPKLGGCGAGSGAGGGGGGDNPSGGGTGGGGGGSGANGGPFFISATTLSGTFNIQSIGGNGGNGAAGSNGTANNGGGGGGGGGGSGGDGGSGVLFYHDKSGWSGSFVLTAGSGGTGASGGSPNGTGGSGTSGSPGATGKAGAAQQLQF